MTEVLDTDAALWALTPEWDALWHRVPGASPFSHPAWLLPWWRQFGTGQPRVAVLRDRGSLCGVLPMYLLDGYGPRQMLPIGVSLSDAADALLTPGTPPDALLAAVLARADGADTCSLPDLPQCSALSRSAVPGGWQAAWSQGAACPVLALSGPLDTLLPKPTLRKLRMNRNRAARAGGTVIEAATPETVAPMLADLVRLHQSRWTAGGQPGVFADPAVARFHIEAAPLLLQAGLLRLHVLRVQGAVAAACYALLPAQDRILFYLTGFDAAHAALSPGTLLLAAMLEQAIAEGRREADFLRGNEAYKYAWGGVDRHSTKLRIVRT